MIALIFILLFTLTVLIPKEIVKNYFNALTNAVVSRPKGDHIRSG